MISMRRRAVRRPSPVVESPSRKMMWPDCSPPRVAPVFNISSSTYLSPTLARSIFIPDVFSAISSPMFDMVVEVAGGGEEYAIAVDDAAGGIAEEGAVGIAVECDTEIELALGFRDHLAQGFGMKCAATFVDVLAVGRDVNERGFNAEVAKKFRRLGRGRAVGTVDEHAQLAQIGRDTGG